MTWKVGRWASAEASDALRPAAEALRISRAAVPRAPPPASAAFSFSSTAAAAESATRRRRARASTAPATGGSSERPPGGEAGDAVPFGVGGADEQAPSKELVSTVRPMWKALKKGFNLGDLAAQARLADTASAAAERHSTGERSQNRAGKSKNKPANQQTVQQQ